MRKLASIQQIDEIYPIEGKDRIVLAVVKGWQVIVQKGEYNPNDKTVFIETDSVLPQRPEFEFLKSKKYRIKTMKMGGVLSQGICFPLSILPPRKSGYDVDEDVTDVIGIKKYEPYTDDSDNENVDDGRFKNLKDFIMHYRLLRPIGKLIFKHNKKFLDGFPPFISKTDEPRIQNMPFILKNKEIAFVGREKIDGQSGTFFVRKLPRRFPWSCERYDFGVCSRNKRLYVPDHSSYWFVAQKYQIEQVLKSIIGDNKWVCIQGECIAPNIQGNKYHVSTPDLFCFNLVYPSGRVPCTEAEKLVGALGLKWAPLVVKDYTLPDNVNDVLDFATGQSALFETLREGVVFRNYDKHISFKAVSPDFLIKHDE